MNSKQQLLALQIDFGDLRVNEVIAALQLLNDQEIFTRLPGVDLVVKITDVHLLPTDLDARLPLTRLLMCISGTSSEDKAAQVRLRHFSSLGARIVIDEFHEGNMWDGAKLIAVDCSKDIPDLIKHWLLRLHGNAHLAQNVSDMPALEQASEAGFKWFSGDYAFHPTVNNKPADATARTRLLKLLGLVARDAESRELESLFKQDATLSFMLFKLVSSAAFAQTVRVSSFGQAINLLGRRQLQRWLQLLLYARQQDHNGSLNPLMPRAAFRASFMEAVFQKKGGDKDQLDCAFMVGMFSLLGKLFGTPLAEVLQPLNLHTEVLDALLHKSGQLGKCLDLVEKADHPNDKFYAGLTNLLDLSEVDYYDCMITAYAWVNQICQDM